MLAAIQARRSIRRYQPERVIPHEVLVSLVEAAIWAPSAHNRQPWRFAIVETADRRDQLAAAMGAQLRADLAADGVDPALIEQDAARSYARITAASALIVLCMTMQDMDRYPDAIRQAAERVMAVQSTALAGQNLLLMAAAQGLGACWMCAPLFCPDVVRDMLNLPQDWEPQALLTLGYPAEEKVKAREALETRLLWR